MSRGAIAVFVLLWTLAAGCGADTPSNPSDPEGVNDQLLDPSDPTAGELGDIPEMSVVVDPLGSSSTCHETIAIQGTATPGADVYAVGGAANSNVARAHSQTGRFCLDVPLRKNNVNQLEVWAKHGEYGPAEPARIAVTHDDGAAGCSTASSAAGSTAAELSNVAQGATVTSKHSPKENSNELVTDGDPETWASWGGGTWWNPISAYDGWVMVSLGSIAEAEKVVVRWRDSKGSGGKYATKYRLLYTATSTESFDENDGIWVQPADGEVVGGEGGEDSFALKGEPIRQLAVRLLHDGSTSWNEKFAIAEIEIWEDQSRGSTTVMPSAAGTCNTLGSY